MVVFVGYVGGAVYGAMKLQPGMKYVDVVLRSSYYYQFSVWDEVYFGQRLAVAFVVDGPIDYAGAGKVCVCGEGGWKGRGWRVSSYYYQFSVWDEVYFGQRLAVAFVVDGPIDYAGAGKVCVGEMGGGWGGEERRGVEGEGERDGGCSPTTSSWDELRLLFLCNFHLVKMKFGTDLWQFKLNSLIFIVSKVFGMKGTKYCFTDCVQTIELWHAFGRLRTDLVQAWFDDRHY